MKWPSLLLIVSAPLAAEDTTHLGHDYARQQVRKAAESSADTVTRKYEEILARIRERIHADDEEAHYVEMATQFELAQRQWLRYRDTHCRLQGYAYVYPAGSRMFHSQINACIDRQNRERITFLEEMEREL